MGNLKILINGQEKEIVMSERVKDDRGYFITTWRELQAKVEHKFNFDLYNMKGQKFTVGNNRYQVVRS